MTKKKHYTDDELTAWLNGEFKGVSSREMERSLSLDSDLQDRVSSLISDISAVQAKHEPGTATAIAPWTTRGKIAVILVIMAIAFVLTWLLFS